MKEIPSASPEKLRIAVGQELVSLSARIDLGQEDYVQNLERNKEKVFSEMMEIREMIPDRFCVKCMIRPAMNSA